MADMTITTGPSDSNGGLYFIVGALLVVVAVIAFMFFNGNTGSINSNPVTTVVEKTTDATPDLNVNIERKD